MPNPTKPKSTPSPWFAVATWSVLVGVVGGTIWLMAVAPWILWLGFTLFVLLAAFASLVAPLIAPPAPSSAKTTAASFVAGILLGLSLGGGVDGAC